MKVLLFVATALLLVSCGCEKEGGEDWGPYPGSKGCCEKPAIKE